jgi:hypothetical protein
LITFGEWSYSSTVFDLGTRWKRILSFTPWPLCLRGDNTWHILDKRLGEFQSRSACCGGATNLPCLESNPACPARNPPLYRLSYRDIFITCWRLYPVSNGYLTYKQKTIQLTQQIIWAETCPLLFLWLYSPCGPWPPFQFLNLYTMGRSPWMRDQPLSRPLPTQNNKQNKLTQTSMPQVGFEPTIPVF